MSEKDNFDAAMRKILKVSKTELQRRLEREKTEKRTPTSASRVPGASVRN
jgi:hypothetical protein